MSSSLRNSLAENHRLPVLPTIHNRSALRSTHQSDLQPHERFPDWHDFSLRDLEPIKAGRVVGGFQRARAQIHPLDASLTPEIGVADQLQPRALDSHEFCNQIPFKGHTPSEYQQSAYPTEYEKPPPYETFSETPLRCKQPSRADAVDKPSWLDVDWLTPTTGTATATVTTRSSLMNNTNVRSFTKATGLCIVDGCTKLSKHNKRCWRHGGSIKCKVADCDNRAKSKGVCWSHGGGTLCAFENCDTISVSKGFCWAHGGGKRCRISSCSRPAYERTRNYCKMHFKALRASLGTTGCSVPVKSEVMISSAEGECKVEWGL